MKILTILFFISFTSLLFADAEDEHRRAKAAFKRYMMSAHPLPESLKKSPDNNILLSEKSMLPNFLNVNTNMDEDPADPNKMQNESSIAVNPKNPSNLIASAVDYRANSSTWVYVSSDGGNTWRNLNLGKPFPEWRSTNDPSVYFDNDGTGYLCYGGFGDVMSGNAGLVGENGVFIARTTDEGITWQAHIPVILHLGTQTMDSTFEDKYYVQVDNSTTSPFHKHLYVPWKRVTPRDSATQIVISKSIDKGLTWSEPVNISDRVSGSSEDTTFGQSFPLASTGPDGELYIVWNHGIEHGIGFAKSLDGGATFTEPRIIHNYNIFGETKFLSGQGYRHVVKGTVRAEAYPVVITDITNGPRRGNIYLCWSADNYPNVYFSKSTDKGETWSNPVIVHSDTTNDQFWQWMSIDPLSGDLSIMYLDSRNDTNNIMVECYVSYSSDGGDTWIDKRVSDINSDLRLNPFANRSFAGDYSGSAFYDGIIYPSWVDMRNAVTNLSNSNVYTAIINTRAPEPPDNFGGESNPENPISVELNWDPPTKRAFGQELKSEDFLHRLVRNNEIIATLSGDESSFSDNNITAFEKYDYKIYAVAGRDSSMAREITSYPGGSKQPDSPILITANGDIDNNVSINIVLPALRSDKITPLTNLMETKLYRNGIALNPITLNPSDTGKTIQATDKPEVLGFYRYKANVSDFFNALSMKTTSELSNEVVTFTGSHLESVSENFDNSPLPYYYITENWTQTNEVYISGNNSFSNAAFTQHKPEQFDTLIFLPVKMPNEDDLYLTFMQICAVYPDDSAFVEVSYNDMESWEIIANYNRDMHEAWKKSIVDNSGWRLERVKIPNQIDAERVFVRFRFISNRIRNGNGWYIDDVVIGQKAVTVDNNDFGNSVKVFPNPAVDVLNIHSGYNEFSNVKLFDLHGSLILEYISDNTSSVELDLNQFNSGSYFLEIKSDKGFVSRKIIFINK